MMGVLNVLVLLLIIIGVAFVGYKLMNQSGGKSRNYSYSRRVLTIFSGYFVLLVLCSVISNVIPDRKVQDWKKVNHNELQQEQEKLFNDVEEGKVNRDFLKTEWKFDFTGKKLKINSQDPEILVVIEKKNMNDHKLEASLYQTRSALNGREITDVIKTPGVDLTDNQLTLLEPQKTKLQFSKFTNVFSVTQFTGKKGFSDSSEWTIGQSVLYIKIPNNIQISSESNLNVQYVK